MDGKLRVMTAVYLSKGSRMLLLYRRGSRVVNDVWVGSAGGHFEECELNDARAAVLRELNEELSLTESEIENLRLRYITLRRTQGEIRQNYYFFAELKSDVDINMSSNEGVSKWFDFSELNSLAMPFSAQRVMRHYLEIGINDDMLYVGVANESDVTFAKMPDC